MKKTVRFCYLDSFTGEHYNFNAKMLEVTPETVANAFEEDLRLQDPETADVTPHVVLSMFTAGGKMGAYVIRCDEECPVLISGLFFIEE